MMNTNRNPSATLLTDDDQNLVHDESESLAKTAPAWLKSTCYAATRTDRQDSQEAAARMAPTSWGSTRSASA
jgi:hypothetical protein